jgi:colicin import membrane protein
VNFWQEFSERLWAVVLAIGVHVLMAALVVLGTMSWEPFRKPQPVGLTIEAVIVDTGEIKRQRDEAQQAVEREDRRQQRAEELEVQKEREQEQKIQREKDAAEKRKRDLEEQRKRDAQDRLQKLRIEKDRKLQEERERQQKELDEVRKQREAAENKRKQDQERLKQTEAKKQRDQLDKERLQREANEEARAFQAGREAELGDKYYIEIQRLVTQNWLRPPTAQSGLRCKLKIIQIPGGEVISAAISGRCNADEATRRSIVAAVERGGSLPYRGYEDVFAREIEFTFIYDGD